MTIQNRQHQSFSHMRSYSFFSEFELLLELNSILCCGKSAVFARDSTALLGQRQHPSQSTLLPVPPPAATASFFIGATEKKSKVKCFEVPFLFVCFQYVGDGEKRGTVAINRPDRFWVSF